MIVVIFVKSPKLSINSSISFIFYHLHYQIFLFVDIPKKLISASLFKLSLFHRVSSCTKWHLYPSLPRIPEEVVQEQAARFNTDHLEELLSIYRPSNA